MEGATLGGVAWAAVIGVGVLLIAIAIAHQWSHWLAMFRYRNRLPPGSYGWPLVGETLSLMTSSPMEFATSRTAKYGKLFRTHLYGDPTIVVTSPDLARVVYSWPYDHVQLTGPRGAERLLGENIMHKLGEEDHEALHKLVQNFFFLPSIEPHLSDIGKLIANQLNAWDGKIVNTFQDSRKIGGNVLMRMFFGFDQGDDDHLLSELVELFRGPYYAGALSIPINLPGMAYYKGVKAREKMADIINYLIEKQEQSAPAGLGKSSNSLLKEYLHYKHPGTGKNMSRSTLIDNLMVVMFAGFDTASSTFSMTLRHLWDNSKALELVKAEQEAIAKRKGPGEPLTMNDLKDMKYTNQVLHETLRFPGPVTLSFRETLHEVNIAGYTIPKGWNVVNVFSVYQQDPSYFSNPTVFDPSRFSEGEGTFSRKGFTPFGGGRHMCPGRELGKVNYKILMHYFFTKFRWEPVNYQQGYQHVPILICSPKAGFPVRAKLIDQ